jgi:hypothetical protein
MNTDFLGCINNIRRWSDEWNEAILAAHTATTSDMLDWVDSHGRSSTPSLEGGSSGGSLELVDLITFGTASVMNAQMIFEWIGRGGLEPQHTWQL